MSGGNWPGCSTRCAPATPWSGGALDRLGRSLRHLIDTVNALTDREVGFRSLTENIDTTTSGRKLVFHIFGALAEFERELIRERTHAGLVAARARGRNGGRPTVMPPDKVAAARQMYDSKQYTVEAIAKVLGVSQASIYRHLGSPAATNESGGGKAAPLVPPPKSPRKPRRGVAAGAEGPQADYGRFPKRMPEFRRTSVAAP